MQESEVPITLSVEDLLSVNLRDAGKQIIRRDPAFVRQDLLVKRWLHPHRSTTNEMNAMERSQAPRRRLISGV